VRSFKPLEIARKRGNSNCWPASDTGRGAMVLGTVERGSLVLALLLVAIPAAAQQGRNWTACINGSNAFPPDVAIGACTDLIQSSSARPGNLYAALTNRGVSYYDKRDYDRAIPDYTAAIQLNLNESTAFNNRGNTYKAKGDIDRAIADFSQAIRINPRSAVAYLNRGIAYSLRRDFDRALADLNEAIRLSPKNAEYFEVRGMIFEAKGDIDRAKANFISAQQHR
jgi:tetratricopeptide (TPR) repeat protein